MMKSAILATTIASACAFAPTPISQTSTSLAATAAQTDFFGLVEDVDFTKEVGVLPPVSLLVLYRRRLCFDDIIYEYIYLIISLILFMYNDMATAIHKTILLQLQIHKTAWIFRSSWITQRR